VVRSGRGLNKLHQARVECFLVHTTQAVLTGSAADLLDFQQFDIEDQGGIRRNRTTGTGSAVSQL